MNVPKLCRIFEFFLMNICTGSFPNNWYGKSVNFCLLKMWPRKQVFGAESSSCSTHYLIFPYGNLYLRINKCYELLFYCYSEKEIIETFSYFQIDAQLCALHLAVIGIFFWTCFLMFEPSKIAVANVKNVNLLTRDEDIFECSVWQMSNVKMKYVERSICFRTILLASNQNQC